MYVLMAEIYVVGYIQSNNESKEDKTKLGFMGFLRR